MERTVGHLVMAGRPWFGNGCQLGVGIDVTRASAIFQLAEVVGQALNSLLMRVGLERVGVAAAASRAICRELPRSFLRVRCMAGGAAGSAFVISRVLCRRMSKRHHRPVRVVVARGAVERSRHVVRDFSGRGTAVVAALTVGHEAGMIEAGRGPRQGAVACAAVLASSARDCAAGPEHEHPCGKCGRRPMPFVPNLAAIAMLLWSRRTGVNALVVWQASQLLSLAMCPGFLPMALTPL